MNMAKGDVEGFRGPAVGGPSTSASIVQVPLSHKDPNKSVLTKAFHHVRDWKTAVKNGRAFAPYSYIERKTRQATRSTVAYGPLGGELIELAQISHQGLAACQTMYRVLCERLNRSNQKWRNVTKALDVLVYVVVRGSAEFVELVKGDSSLKTTLARLEGFQAVIPDATARDVGAAVRSKAKELSRLLSDDPTWLNEARERGEIQSQKMAGIKAVAGPDTGTSIVDVSGAGPDPGSPRSLGASSPAGSLADGHHRRTLSSESLTSTKGVSEDESALHLAALKKLLARPENLRCADCGLKSPRPTWASVNLGVFLCLRCAGIHRSLGVHLSQVRSCLLDVWTFEQLEIMLRCGGNAIANSFWECHLAKKPDMMTLGDLERFVLLKYVERSYVPREPVAWPPGAINDEDLEGILWEAMGETRREAYLNDKAGRAVAENAGAGLVDAAPVQDVALISLMDDDVTAMEGLIAEDESTRVPDAVSEREFFEGVMMGTRMEVKPAYESPPPVTPAPPRVSAFGDAKPPTGAGDDADDLSLLFSLESNPIGPAAVPLPVNSTRMETHERKAVDMITATLNDFDISSSIASSVSPQSRPKSSSSTPMRPG